MTKKTQTASDTAPEDIIHNLENAAENVGRYARKAFKESPTVAEGAESLVAVIREQPVKSSLIAAGVGLVLGLLLSRR